MTSQYDFTTTEWDQITAAPLIVGYAVAKAEDSGFLGSIRETRSLLSTVSASVDDNPAQSLISQAAAAEADQDTSGLKAASPEVLADAAVTACQELTTILSAKAKPDEAEGYKQWVLSIANTVAEAAKEHGVRTSPAEAALIERLQGALGI